VRAPGTRRAGRRGRQGQSEEAHVSYGYMLYPAERVKTGAEQREADAELGRRIAALGQLRRSLGRRVRSLLRAPSTVQEREAGCPPCPVRPNWS
jgi:hypothetical protein